MSRHNPFVGPSPLGPGDGIYGRDDEIEQLLNILLSERVVLLHAPSGAGKSSLVAAGLIPAIQAEDFEVLPTIRVNQLFASAQPETGNRYLHSVLLSLERAYGQEDDSEQEQFGPQLENRPELTYSLREHDPLDDETFLAYTTLTDYLEARWQPNETRQPQLLIFDQFEEILTVAEYDRDGKREFFRLVGRALRNRNLYALFVIRDDYVAGLEQYARHMPARLANHFALDLLPESGAVQAIQGIAGTQKVEVTEQAAKRLVNDLRRVTRQHTDGQTETVLGTHVEPVLLQVSCLKLWNDLEADGSLGDNLIDIDDLSGTIDISGALGAFYADVVADVARSTEVSERQLRSWIAENLISGQGIRKQVLLEGLILSGMPSRVLLRLRDKYLLRIERRHNAGWFELAHDRLVRPVQENNDTWNAVNLNLLQRRALLWQSQKEPPGLLLTGEDLSQAERWSDQHKPDMTDLDWQFLKACQAQRQSRAEAAEREILRQRQRRTQSWAAGIIGVIMLAALILTIVLLQQAQRDRDRAVAAEATADAARAEAEINLTRAIEQEAIAVTARAEAEINLTRAIEQEATAVAAANIAATARAEAETAQQEAVDQAATAAAEAERANLAQAEAEQNAALAAASKLLTSSKAVFGVDPNLSGLLAIQAYRLLPADVAGFGSVERDIVDQIESTLSLPQPNVLGGDALDLSGSQTLISEDDRFLITATPVDREVILRIWSADVANENAPFWICDIPSTYTAIAMSPDNDFIAVLSSRSLQVWPLTFNVFSGTQECGTPLDLRFENNQRPSGFGQGGGQALTWIDQESDLLIVGSGRFLSRWRVDRDVPANTDTTLSAGEVTFLRLTDYQEVAIGASANLRIDHLEVNIAPNVTVVGSAEGLLFAIQAAADSDSKVFGARRWFDTNRPVREIAMTATGEAVILNEDGSVYFWAPYAEDANLSEIVPASSETVQIAANSDSNLWAFGDDASVTVRQGGTIVAKFQHSHGFLTALDLSEDGQQVMTAGTDGNVRLWDVNDLLPQLIRTDGTAVTSAYLGLRPRPYLLVTGEINAPIVWLLENTIEREQQFDAHNGEVFGMAVSPLANSSLVITGDESGNLISWETDTLSPLQTLKLTDSEFLGRVAWHPQGDLVAVGDGNGILHLLEVSEVGQFNELRQIETEGGLIFATTFSADGQWLITGNNAGDILIWPVDQLRGANYRPDTAINLVQLDERFGPSIWDIELSADNRWLIIGAVNTSFEDTVLVWDFAKVRDNAPDALHAYAQVLGPLGMTFAETEQMVVVGDEFGNLFGFTIPATRRSRRPINPTAFLGQAHNGWITDIAVNPVTGEIVTASDVGQASVWRIDAAEGFRRVNAFAEPQPIWSVAISPAGNRILLGKRDGTIRINTIIDPEEILTAACTVSGINLSYEDWQQFVDETGQRVYELTCPGNPLPEGGHCVPVLRWNRQELGEWPGAGGGLL